MSKPIAASRTFALRPGQSVRPRPGAREMGSYGTLGQWLEYIARVHPQSIAMGLDRVAEVRQALRLNPRFPVITVTGTNGKGSTCAMLEAMLGAAGYRVGCYTSPHLLDYTERVRIDRAHVDELTHVQAFSRVESARGTVPLTYFEFGTLAAMDIFVQARVDVAILEVGLGGRMDAVNVFDADCAVVTSVALDHMEYLGATRELIGFEKAGIFRAGRPAVCAEPDTPEPLIRHAAELGAELLRIGRTFTVIAKAAGWTYRGPTGALDLPYPALRGAYQLQNASAAITALIALAHRLPVGIDAIRQGLRQASVTGRFQIVQTAPTVILDVAHNPHAAAALAENLGALGACEKTIAVFAMLKDKDIDEVARVMKRRIDLWHVAGIVDERGATPKLLRQALENAGVATGRIAAFATPAEAYFETLAGAGKNVRIVVFGSFHTVADVLRLRASTPTTMAAPFSL